MCPSRSRAHRRCLEPDPAASAFRRPEALQSALDRLDERGLLLRGAAFDQRARSGRGRRAVALALAGAVGGPSRKPLPERQHEPVSILIADFQNRTGDPGFDGTLEPALGLSVEGASFITAYRRDQARDLAAQIKAGTTPRRCGAPCWCRGARASRSCSRDPSSRRGPGMRLPSKPSTRRTGRLGFGDRLRDQQGRRPEGRSDRSRRESARSSATPHRRARSSPPLRP